MGQKSDRISSREFASLSGLSVSGVSRLLREGKIKGKKKSGKWMIPKSQLGLKAVREIAKKKKPVSTRKKREKVQKDPISGNTQAAEANKQQDQRLSPPSPATPPARQTVRKKTYSIAEFSAMTYLTDFGVKDWLKKGRLKGSKDKSGQWHVDAASLELPNIKRLLRE